MLSRKIDEQGRLLTKRLHIIYQEIPAFLKAIVGNVVTYGGEESIVDPNSQTVEIRSRNLSFCNQRSIKETCRYSVSTSNLHQTLVKRHLEVCGCVSVFLNKKLENWYMLTDLEIYKTGVKVINEILENVTSKFIPAMSAEFA